MEREKEIGAGLSRNEKKRMQIFLSKFLGHVTSNTLTICGGLATQFHLEQYGIKFPKRPFNDLDFLIESPGDIDSSIVSDFFLYHYHPANPQDPVEPTYFFYAFVDKQSRMKADVFPYRWSDPKRFVKATFQGKSINVCGIEDQLIQCLYDVSRISEKQKVDPKQLNDVHTLMQIADVKLAKQIWKRNSHPLYPKTLSEAIKKADMLVTQQPNWWQAKPYRKLKPYVCSFCQNRSSYPITDMNTIYKVLGYVE